VWGEQAQRIRRTISWDAQKGWLNFRVPTNVLQLLTYEVNNKQVCAQCAVSVGHGGSGGIIIKPCFYPIPAHTLESTTTTN
jgi:hypothetical protein